jgi:hypothetical protein
MVCTWIGAQAMIDTEKTGGRNPLVDAALELDIFGGARTEAELEAERELDAIRGEKVADHWQDDPRIAPVGADPDKGVEASNPDGSFEAMLRMMGGGGMGPAPMPGIEQAASGDAAGDGGEG